MTKVLPPIYLTGYVSPLDWKGLTIALCLILLIFE
jgi:hypothetical protein